MKCFQVFIRCRELPSAHAEYTYRETASAFHVAVANALRKFKREPHVQRRRLTCLEIRVSRATWSVTPRRVETIDLPLFCGGEHGS